MFYKPGPLTDGVSCRGQIHDTNRRYEPLKGPVVYGYPSNGGTLIKGVSAVELLHLDLDRFREAKRSPNAADENEFCKRLRKIGAAWWPSEGHWINAVIGEGDSERGAKLSRLAGRVLDTGFGCSSMMSRSGTPGERYPCFNSY